MTTRALSANRRHDRGLTLVEVMVAGTLLAVVLGAAMLMLANVNSSSERVRRLGDAQGTARMALDVFESELRAAGVGASRGHIGVAPAGGALRRVPVIYSEPSPKWTWTSSSVVAGATPVTTAGGAQLDTASVFIISAEPATIGITADGTGMQGVVTSVVKGQPLTALCADATGAVADCADAATFKDSTIFTTTGGKVDPVIVSDDFHWAVMISPTLLEPATDPTQKKVTFAEQSSPAFEPDAKKPFGFGHAAHLLKARVTHWYLKPTPGDASTYELVRSRPTLRATAFTAGACDPTESPFVDETNGGTAVGVPVGSGPIDAVMARYVLGVADGSDTPAAWTLNPAFTSCDQALAERLREVRVGVVSRSVTPDPDLLANPAKGLYTLPPMEGAWMITNSPVALAPGTVPTAADMAPVSDAYPRRSFLTRVVPRNALGYLP